jgi:hypothetical protein
MIVDKVTTSNIKIIQIYGKFNILISNSNYNELFIA